MKFLKTTDLFAAVKELLTPLELPVPEEFEGDAPALFERVEFYDSQKLAEGLRALGIFKSRACLLVPGGDTYSNALDGNSLRTSQATEFHMLIADRDYSAKPGAFFGSDKNIGVLDMKDIVVDALAGNRIAGGGVLVPVGGGALTLPDKQSKDTPGRECWVVSWQIWTGQRRTVAPHGMSELR